MTETRYSHPKKRQFKPKPKDVATKEMPTCGSLNTDGTFFGGGPLDVHCSACAKAGEATHQNTGTAIEPIEEPIAQPYNPKRPLLQTFAIQMNSSAQT